MTISETIMVSKFDAMLKEMKAIKELLQIMVKGDEVTCAENFPITIIPPKTKDNKDTCDTEEDAQQLFERRNKTN